MKALVAQTSLVVGESPNFFMATVLPHKIGMPDNIFCKLLFRNRNYAQGKITRQEKQQPSA